VGSLYQLEDPLVGQNGQRVPINCDGINVLLCEQIPDKIRCSRHPDQFGERSAAYGICRMAGLKDFPCKRFRIVAFI
jgi:hypothetical protein